MGDIDLMTVTILVDNFDTAARPGGPVVIDLTAVPFCSGIGFRALGELQHGAVVPLAWVVPSPWLARLLRETGAARLSCHRDLAAALAALG